MGVGSAGSSLVVCISHRLGRMVKVRLPIELDLEELNRMLEDVFSGSGATFFRRDAFPKIVAMGDHAPFMISVAVENDEVIGVAVSWPFTLPAQAGAPVQMNKQTALLNFITVKPPFRGRGIGARLLQDQMRLYTVRGIRLALAHIPRALAEFYEAAGWTAHGDRIGFAWQYVGKSEMLLADVADRDQYDTLVSRVLLPHEIAYTFEFRDALRKPGLDSVRRLAALVGEGTIPATRLSPVARKQMQMVEELAAVANLRGAFGQRSF